MLDFRAMRWTRREFAAGVAAAGAWAGVRGRHLMAEATSEWPPDAKRLAADPLRPQYHLLPKYGWMNDPNAPVFWNGKYHMFFQYNPEAAIWGDMHWAHAVSEDMVRWKHLPVALSPTPGGADAAGCFSGSFIVDPSGGGKGRAGIIYTGIADASGTDATLHDGVHTYRETQCFATTEDPMLLSWDKLPKPVIANPPEGMDVRGFRDPAIWRDGDWYYMTLGSGIKNKGGLVLLYRSPAMGKEALRSWEYMHPLVEGDWSKAESANAVDTGKMWECPEFFPLDGWHVLLYSTKGKVFWETGHLDAKTMRFQGVKRGLVDAGAYYAAKSQLDAKGNRVLWGWVQETRPAAEYAAAGWAGCMSLPRRLNVAADGTLEMRVDGAVEELRGEKVVASGEGKSSVEIPLLSGVVGLKAVMEGQAQLVLKDASGVRARIQLLKTGAAQELVVEDEALPLEGNGPVEVQAYFDGSVLEVIVGNRASATVRSYGSRPKDVSADAGAGVVKELSVWKMKPISGDRLTT
jgi:beta-fructofuranosidase